MDVTESLLEAPGSLMYMYTHECFWRINDFGYKSMSSELKIEIPGISEDLYGSPKWFELWPEFRRREQWNLPHFTTGNWRLWGVYVTQCTCSCRYVLLYLPTCTYFHLHRAKCYMDSTLLRRTPTNVKPDKLLGFTSLITLFKGVQSSTRTVIPSQ